ncbi:MAG: hypothetical protein KJZ77_17050 [Anaerolineales bacterium]|nr:hypothetical protein [Anaerolineales bacterium]
MNDDRYLNLLSIFHLIVGSVAGLFSCFPLVNLSMGLSTLSDIPKSMVQGDAFSPFTFLSIMFILLPIGIVVLGWMFAIAVSLNGYFIKTRHWHTYCLVVGGIETIFMPFGTILGIFPIILLTKPEIKVLFDQGENLSN